MDEKRKKSLIFVKKRRFKQIYPQLEIVANDKLLHLEASYFVHNLSMSGLQNDVGGSRLSFFSEVGEQMFLVPHVYPKY